MSKEMPARYNHQEVETGKYEYWLKNRCFESGQDKSKPPFCIVIPPPNVTGKLHLGHAWDGTLQDLIIRYKHLKGFDTLWVPGCDHAGIATQAKVEEKLRKEGISRYDLGREKFLDVAWKWKHEYHNFILDQWKVMGLSLDYNKERFTLDEGLSRAVKEVFVRLYKEGLIYQGQRIINWDPVQKTALSNIEVIYEEHESYMYYFRYYLEGDKSKYLEVATTRPETMFGDVCVVVHPEDARYKDWVGKKVINPANGDLLPVITDEYIDREFGTGAMKCTPAHDPNDFIIGEKYHFPKPICMNPDGTMNEICGKYQGMDRFECREALLKDCQDSGSLIKIEKHINNIGYSERSHAIVEPYLSKQWFVKMDRLAKQALDNQKTDGKVNFYPERFEKIFTNWMSNIEDWCISRQLWWGHRIPAWYHKETGEVYVDVNPPKDIKNYIQDEDVLDTWFSSALWPFTTLGWPEPTEDIKRYFPTDVLVTGYDIIFFWVSRMIFQSLQFTGKRPFKATLIHGLIRDEKGKKMSKSAGNGVDPIDVINKYGADALRYFLTTNSAPGLDLRYSDEKINAAWNFINKIWNASRFCIMNFPEGYEPTEIDYANTSIYERLILKQLNETIEKMEASMEKYEFVIAGTELYNFIWDDFCSVYVEMAKLGLQSENKALQSATQSVMFYVLDAILKLAHPFMPFVTEDIYQTLHNEAKGPLINSKWPEIKEEYSKQYKEGAAESIIDIIKTIRTMKNDNNIAPNKNIELYISIKDEKLRKDVLDNKHYIERFCFATKVEILDKLNIKEQGKAFALKSGIDLFIPLKGLINFEEELNRLNKEKERLESEIRRCEGMLNNPNFISKAPAEKIENEKKKLHDYKVQKESVEHKIGEYQEQNK